VLALIVALVSGGTSKTKVSGAASHRTTVAPGAAGSAGSQGPAGSTSDGSQLQAVKSASGLNGTPGMPLSVMVSNTQGLKDGDAVAVHVIPQKGSVVYGFEAFLCKAGVSYTLDPDIRPDDTGKCIAHPLSANSQDYIQVKASPPYSSADTTFRVGVGTDHFALTDGTPATVTCGPGHLCVIVLKLQYPNAFGFQVIPISYR
jgi:hypothetical protein